jgi:methyl-accepting chemotaxis protein
MEGSMSREKSGSKSARLSSKILLAMGSVLFLFALVIGLFFYTVMMQGPGSKQPSTQVALLAEQMKASLLEAQRNESLFLLHPHLEPISKHKAAVTQLLSLSRQMAEISQQTAAKKNPATASNINNSVQQLDAAFLNLVQAREAKGVSGSPGMLEKLSSSGRQLEGIISRNEVGNLALAFLRIQHHEQEYFRTSTTIELENLRTAIKNFSRLLMYTKIEPVEAQILRKGTREYKSALDRFQAVSLATSDHALSTSLENEQERQADAMRSAADNIESVINRVNVPNALLMVLILRQHEADYLLTTDKKYAQQVHDGLDALIKTFTTSSILQEHRNQALKASTMYRDAFTSLVTQDGVIEDHLAKLNKTASSLEDLINNTAKITSQTTFGEALPFAGSGNNLGLIAAIAGLAVILIGFLIAILLGKSISKPIISMTKIIHKITTDKDFSIEIPVNSKNEIGILAQELNTLLRLQGTMFSQESVTSGLSEDMKVLTDITDDLQRQIERAAATGNNISSSAAGQNELADKIDSSITQLAASTYDMNQMFSQSDEQNKLITDAVEHIGRSVESTVEGIKDITRSSSQISDIISLSTEIAEQTNLLALNASVKAARAGSHGKEFALIADEIAKLAQRSEEIAEDAGQLTINLNTKVDEAIKLGDESKISLDQVHEAGRLNLLTAEELAKQAAVINTTTDELGHLAKSLAATVRKIESMAGEQGSECTAALGSVASLLEKFLLPGDETRDEDDDVTLKQTVDNIAIPLDEQEENDESSTGNTDDAATEETDAEYDETLEDDDTEFKSVATDEVDNSKTH